MISALLHVVQYAIAIIASVFQDAYQDVINVIATLAFAAQLYAMILVAAYAFALHANAILEEDASLLAIMSADTYAKFEIYIFNNIFLG